MSDHDYTALLDTVVRPLLTAPDAFSATQARNKNGVLLEFTVDSADTGRVIGKGGATIRAIRTTCEFAANANDDRISVELVDG